MTGFKQLFLMGFLVAAVTGCATRAPATIDRNIDGIGELGVAIRGLTDDRQG